MRFIKPVVKIPAHSGLGIHALSARPVDIRDSRAGSPNVGRACYDTISILGNSVTVVIARSVEGNASVIELIGGGIGASRPRPGGLRGSLYETGRPTRAQSPSALLRKLHTRAPVHRLGVLDQRELRSLLRKPGQDIRKPSPQLKFGLDALY
jgi:hypothetical protein